MPFKQLNSESKSRSHPHELNLCFQLNFLMMLWLRPVSKGRVWGKMQFVSEHKGASIA